MIEVLTIETTLALLGALGILVFRWAFRHLPEEGWQIAFAIPLRTRSEDGNTWSAVNITFYGVISAIAYALAVLVYVFLVAAHRQPLLPALMFASLLLVVGIPASKWVARWVEGIPGHTIGGAVFAVIVVSVPSVYVTKLLAAAFGLPAFDAIVLIAAACVAYALGESIGRLACLSFGCCYGRPIESCTSLQKALYSRFTETYRGRFKKIAYAGGLNDREVIAVQSIACVVLFTVFLFSFWLLWSKLYAASIVVALGGSQLWRLYSEQLRADYRGREGFTVYQGMAVVGVLVSVLFAWFAQQPSQGLRASAAAGWFAVTRPEVLLCAQLLAVLITVYMGRSTVTSSRLQMQLHSPSKT
jgi:hypothetical protein